MHSNTPPPKKKKKLEKKIFFFFFKINNYLFFLYFFFFNILGFPGDSNFLQLILCDNVARYTLDDVKKKKKTFWPGKHSVFSFVSFGTRSHTSL